MNVLFCGAHPDDIEMMSGGFINKIVSEGHNAYGLLFTDGSWTNAKGLMIRTPEEGIQEAQVASKFLGYNLTILNNKALDFTFTDQLVVGLLNMLEKYDIDTLVLPWDKDLHPDHKVVAQIGIAASRKIPRVLFGQLNYYVDEFFKPNVFIDISDHIEKKIEALSFYKSVWEKNEKDWSEFIYSTNNYYGKIINSKYAEGYFTNKYLL